ncbi:Mrp/NBP35 family ATP-binding protein [uncultured Levyella sp.]|uniref:Mrp/NBP35 family ATP-binding protein n=1 Tax=uncultured Levyella sp. TaxID=1715800 RepID=UPI00258CE246|nr:Mrp/NBP35 family ATP-binding protein [uncultured Levyella sp.]
MRNEEETTQQTGDGDKARKKPVFYQPPHEKSRIRHIIAVMSGKGGVGKSMVTSLTALAMQRTGRDSAILDADITGPSIPHAFGLQGGLTRRGDTPYARRTESGIQIVSTNLILPHDTDPVLWKGALIGSAIQQFWTDVVYEDVEYLFVDMPPGTGDVPLTVFQTLPVDGVLIITSPQELVSMVVEKAINMTKMMQIPVFGIIENMSYFEAPDTGKQYAVFGESSIATVAAQNGLPLLARLPIDPQLTHLIDAGRVEEADTEAFRPILSAILERTEA